MENQIQDASVVLTPEQPTIVKVINSNSSRILMSKYLTQVLLQHQVI